MGLFVVIVVVVVVVLLRVDRQAQITFIVTEHEETLRSSRFLSG